MKILVISEVFPFPAIEGRRAAINPLLECLGKAHEVLLCAFNDQGEMIKPEHIKHVSAYCRVVAVHDLNPVGWASVAGNVFDRYPLCLKRYDNEAFKKDVLAVLENERIDVVHFYGVNVAQFHNLAQGFPSILEGPDCTYMFFERMARDSRTRLHRKLYYKWQARKMRRYEAETFCLFERCFVVGSKDREALLRANARIAVTVVPLGCGPMRSEGQPDNWPKDVPTIVFSGYMAAEPNIQAAEFFYKEIWPLLKVQIPDLHWMVVGHKPGESITRMGTRDRQIIVTGYVESVSDYLRHADVFVCPLQSASGVQTRLLEASALGKAIVCSSCVAAAAGLVPGVHAMVADKPNEVADHIVKLLHDVTLRENLGYAAMRAVEGYSWDRVAIRCLALYNEAIMEHQHRNDSRSRL